MKINVDKLKKSNDLALLLGMFAGDGCLSISHNGDGNRTYPITFYNINKNYVIEFQRLFYINFGIIGYIDKRIRKNKQILWNFRKHSVKIYNMLMDDFEMTNGKKALSVFIPSFIMNGSNNLKKYFFIGLLVTDGGLRKDNSMIFHSASKRLLDNLQLLIKDVWGFEKPIRKYIQREKYESYQLNLNTNEGSVILTELPMSHNLVLR